MWYIFSEPPSSESCFATRLITGGAGRRWCKPDVQSQSPPLCFPRVYGYPPLPRPAFHNAVEFPATPHSPCRVSAAQRANRADNRGVDIRAGSGNHPAGKRRGVELMLGIQHQRNMHRLFPALGWLFTVQQMQEMAADGIIVGFRLNTFAVVAVVIPVKKDRAERGQQLIGNIARAGDGMSSFPAGCSPARKRRYASRPSGAKPPVTLPERYGHWRVIRAAL